MTDEQINIAIAEACGWTEIQEGDPWGTLIGKPNRRIHRDPWHGTEDLFEIPDYCNDLNAMHEAEKTLNQHQSRVYSDYLNESPQSVTWISCYVFHQTARQRAESFLKAIGKWEH